MKAILIIDVDDLDIENTQATHIELKCGSHTRQVSLINHWLMPMPKRINPLKVDDSNLLDLGYLHGRNDLINQLEGEENE